MLDWLITVDAETRREYFALLSASALTDLRRALMYVAGWQPALHGPIVREMESALEHHHHENVHPLCPLGHCGRLARA